MVFLTIFDNLVTRRRKFKSSVREDLMSILHSKLLKLVRRSKLFVPVNRENFVAKAWTRGADCIILDLEDAIAPSDKASL